MASAVRGLARLRFTSINERRPRHPRLHMNIGSRKGTHIIPVEICHCYKQQSETEADHRVALPQKRTLELGSAIPFLQPGLQLSYSLQSILWIGVHMKGGQSARRILMFVWSLGPLKPSAPRSSPSSSACTPGLLGIRAKLDAWDPWQGVATNRIVLSETISWISDMRRHLEYTHEARGLLQCL